MKISFLIFLILFFQNIIELQNGETSLLLSNYIENY